MKRVLMFVFVALVAFASCKRKEPADTTVVPQFSSDPVGNALAGHPDDATRAVAGILQNALALEELDYLVHIDWSKMTGQGFMSDPVIRKALRAIADNFPRGDENAPQALFPKAHPQGPDDPCANTSTEIEAQLKIAVKQILLGAAVGFATCSTAEIGVNAVWCASSVLMVAAGVSKLHGEHVAAALNALDNLFVNCSQGSECFIEKTNADAVCKANGKIFNGCTCVPGASGCKTAPPSNVCGVYPQCGCGSLATCDIADKETGATHCVLSMGNGGLKSYCKTTADCKPGLACEDSACRPFCAGEGVQCPEPGAGVCGQTSYNNKLIPNDFTCDIECVFDDPNSCGPSLTCIRTIYGDVNCIDSSGANNATCGPPQNLCSAGFSCVNDGTCAKNCRIQLNNCPAGKHCYPLTPKLIKGGVEFGFCYK